uniref:Dynein 2 intermediate chain 1 n=1 Tax=Labrus bergylta TaxID=56723 RepID=A0A3Q3G1H7_9LABR|nr:WD repeat-containing protein 60 isoform X2 [Labrus bergylta]
MHSDKKEDTWRPADLRKHIREEGHGNDHVRRREDSERKRRGGESTDRRHRDPEKEPKGERDQHRERESTRARGDQGEKDRYADRRKEGSRDRREEREREKRREREKLAEEKRKDENREKRRDREEKHDRDKERVRDKEERAGQNYEEREKRRERRRLKDAREGEETCEQEKRKQHEERQRHKEEHEERQRHKEEHEERQRHKEEHEERREKHRKRSELKEAREPREEHRRHQEERERRQGERRHQDEKRKYNGESREHGGPRASGEEVRHHGGDRERAERDKDRERRRHRERAEEEEERERNPHRDRTEKSEKTEVLHADDPAEQEYEDDFEDYEEDFEEMDESANEDEVEKEPGGGSEEGEGLTAQRRKEIEAIQRAMDEENERVGTARSRGSTSREEEDESRGSEKNQKKASQRGKFIDFVAAKQREVSKKVATEQKKRSTELLRLIDLDSSLTVSLLDLPPVNEYNMYIRNFGTANTKQAYVQCNEENADRDIQTEEIHVRDKWTQHPADHSGACGDPNVSQEEKTRNEIKYDSQRLAAFLHSASQVVVVLLEEDQAEKKSLRKLESPSGAPSFSDGSLQLNTKLSFLYGRHISLLHFSQVQRHTVMSVHDPTTEPSAVRLDSYTIVCVWNIREPFRPQKVLVYDSQIHCCCFSPGKATLVFAGTSVGSVVLWDLREHIRIHPCMKIGEEEWTFRQPTFSTDAVLAGSGHLSSVTSVEVVPSAAAAGGGSRPGVPLLASEEESSGSSFQLASLDESGLLNFWVVVELPKANEAGSPTDLGLRPGGKVKLLHSSSLLTAERVSPHDALTTGPSQTQHLKFLPTDCNHFFIGTNMGLVTHGTSHGLKAPPKFYRFQEAGPRPVDVTSISFNPFVSHLFLVGCSDGSIRLHAVSHEQPVAQWTAGEAVVSLHWTKTRPAVFCALDGASKLHIWDLMSSDSEPVVTERIHSDRVTAVATFGDSGQHNTYSGIGLAHESGKIEMLYFSRKFTVPVMAEEEKLESVMGDAF